MIAIPELFTGARACLLAIILSTLAACGSGGSSGDDANNLSAAKGGPAGGMPNKSRRPTDPENDMLQGVVIDGPVAGADVVFIDATGTEVARATTDSDARFAASIPEDATYPLAMTATGGLNLTTGTAPEFVLRGVLSDREEQHAVISALSTLAIAWAECAAIENDGSPEDGIQSLLSDPQEAEAFLGSHGFALASGHHAYLLGGRPVTAEAAAGLFLASESLAETLRRASTALNEEGEPVTQDELLWSTACDQSNTLLEETTRGTEIQRMAAFRSAATAVNVEAISGSVRVARLDRDVTSLLEQAIVDTFDFDQPANFDSLPIGSELLDALQTNVYAMLTSALAEPLFELYADLLAAHPDTPRAEIEPMIADAAVIAPIFHAFLLDVSRDATVAEAFLDVANVDSTLMPPPHIELEASSTDLRVRGGSTSISYKAEHAQVCHRIGAEVEVWNGLSGPSAQLEVGPIYNDTTLYLSCAGAGGVAETSIEVTVPAAVQITFTRTSTEASDFIALGDEVRVEIKVVDGTETDCSLLRSDTGTEMASGDAVIAEPGMNFEATCEVQGGVALTATSLPVRAAKLSWVPPSETENDVPLTLADLAGYRIYHGVTPGQYDDPVITISDPESTEFVDSFPPGTRYFVMTALSKDGIESKLSNEVIRNVP